MDKELFLGIWQRMRLYFRPTKDIETTEAETELARQFYEVFRDVSPRMFHYVIWIYQRNGGVYFPKPGELFGLLPYEYIEDKKANNGETNFRWFELEFDDLARMKTVRQQAFFSECYERERAKADARWRVDNEERHRNDWQYGA